MANSFTLPLAILRAASDMAQEGRTTCAVVCLRDRAKAYVPWGTALLAEDVRRIADAMLTPHTTPGFYTLHFTKA